MELEEEDDRHHDDNIENNCSNDDNNRKDGSKVSCFELSYQSWNADQKDNSVDESEKNRVEKHE